LPSSPAPASTSNESVSNIAASPSPATSDSTSAAVPCASSPSPAPPVPDGVTRHGSAAATPPRAALSERASPADWTYARLFGRRAPSAPVPSGTVTGPSASDPVTLPTTVSDFLPNSEAKHRH
jgi:hypothetical protein